MFCSNCGTQNSQGEMFCHECGMRLENTSQPQAGSQQNMQYSNNTGTLNQAYIDKAVNPNMKIWAILSIIIPAVAIIWYWFIGLSFLLAIVIAGMGISFAQKVEMADKKLATIGKVLNGALFGLAIVMFILTLIGII